MRRTTLFAILLLASTLRADLPAIRLTSVFPPGARAGTTVDVTVTGADLDDLSDLRFSHPGVFARPAVDAAGAPQPNRFIVAVGPAVPPGVYDARAVGRFGISTPVAFAVGDLPELNETATNASPGGATEIPVGSVVNGVAASSAVDHFRFAGKAGQRVFIDCAARDIDSRLEPVVVLTDAAGRELDRTRRGSPIDFTPPADGAYVVQVHDQTFRGGPSFFYRLSIAARPHIDFILPPAGVPGTRGRYVLYGRNLPGGAPAEGVALDGKPLQQLAVEIELPAAGAAIPGPAPVLPSQAAVRGFPYRLRGGQGTSNPVSIAFTDTPPAAEPADNDRPEQPASLPAPFNVAGRFYPQRDRDWYAFDAKKGEAWWVEVFSHRLGVPSDPFLLVQRVTKNEKGETQSADVQEVYDTDANAGGADFNTSTRDPAFRIEAKEDGSYRVQVRDLFNTTRDDPRLSYVLSVRKEKPDFQLLAAPVRVNAKEAPAAPLLRKGGAVPLRVIALRGDGFNGEIKLSVEGLPPGVTCAGATIAAGSTAASLVFLAGEGAAGWAGPVRVVGTADVGGTPVTREASGATVIVNAGEPPAEAMHSRLTRDVALAVSGSEVAPVVIEPTDAKTLEVPVGGKVTVPLKLTWRAEATGKVKLKAGGHSTLDNAPDSEIDAKAAAATVELDLNRNKLPPGTHTLYVRAEAKVKYTRNPEAARAAAEAKQAAEKAAADATAAAKGVAEKLVAAKAGADAEATKAAEKAAADADAAAKQAEQRVKEAAARAVELGPKDADAVVYSAPVLVRVVPAK